jgi:1,2-diacylglycerol-3-alpha-glucose alpha-1,2-galactosyltransferase
MQTHRNGGESHDLVVNLVSETADGYQGHGVHTVFLETRDVLKRAGVEVRVNSREPADVVHVQTMGLRSLRHLLRDRRRSVLTMHFVPGSFVGSFIGASAWLPIGSAYMRWFCSLASEVVAVSPDVVDWLESGAMPLSTRLIPNGIDVSRFVPRSGDRVAVRERLGIAVDAFVAICVGQVQPRKGVDAFIETARRMPHVTFVWVGGLPFKRLSAGYERMLRAMDEAPHNCLFIGEEPHDEIGRFYAAADCLFFPSMQETFGLTIVEAAAAGLPLVLNDLDTYAPLFGDAFVPAAPGAYEDALEALRTDAELRSHYAARSRDLAKRYDTSHLAERLLEVYGDVARRAEMAPAGEGLTRARRRMALTLGSAIAALRKSH